MQPFVALVWLFPLSSATSSSSTDFSPLGVNLPIGSSQPPPRLSVPLPIDLSDDEEMLEERFSDEVLRAARTVFDGRKGRSATFAEHLVKEGGSQFSPAPVFTLKYFIRSRERGARQVVSGTPSTPRGQRLSCSMDFFALPESSTLMLSGFYQIMDRFEGLNSISTEGKVAHLFAPSTGELLQLLSLVDEIFDTSFDSVYVPSEMLSTKSRIGLREQLGALGFAFLVAEPKKGLMRSLSRLSSRSSPVEQFGEEDNGMVRTYLTLGELNSVAIKKEEVVEPCSLTNLWHSGAFTMPLTLNSELDLSAQPFPGMKLRKMEGFEGIKRGFGPRTITPKFRSKRRTLTGASTPSTAAPSRGSSRLLSRFMTSHSLSLRRSERSEGSVSPSTFGRAATD